ncbi:MAG TPA: T9SS type A sorting domain-containing protein, partial [Paludibacteraceae bacterium]|nr:T9SS type A sorting domain-containing protein [Paludibacteraceae bacterium]
YTQAGKIVVENVQNLPVTIYDVTGRLVTSGSSVIHEFTVPHAGVYIVTVGTQTMKVVVP